MSAQVELFAFDDARPLAEAVGGCLGLDVGAVDLRHFPDGESLVHVESAQLGQAFLFRSLDDPNQKLFDVLLAADALRRQGVERITLVAPYLGYMRQDRIFHPGEPISQQVMARVLDQAFDGVLTVEAHLHRIRSLSQIFRCQADSFSAAEPIARWLSNRPRRGLLVGPDSESEPWIRSVAQKANAAWIVASKERHADRDVRIDLPALPGDHDEAWIIDDIASSGATLESIVGILSSRGVRKISAIVVHALMNRETEARLERAGLERLVSTDSIAHPTNAISLAPLLADVIQERTLVADDT